MRKSCIELAGSFTKEMDDLRLSMHFAESLGAFQRITQCKITWPCKSILDNLFGWKKYHYDAILESMTWDMPNFVDKCSRFLFLLSLNS